MSNQEKNEQFLTVKEIAELKGVGKRAAQNWVNDGLFPNAIKHTDPIYGDIWKVPASDLKDFVKPKAGRRWHKEKEAA